MKTSGQKKRSLYKLKVYVESVFPHSSVKYLAANYMSQCLLSLFFHISLHFYLFSNNHKVFFLCTHLQTLKERIMKLVNVWVWLQGERCQSEIMTLWTISPSSNSHWFSNIPKMITSKGKITVFLLCWMETWWKRIRLGVWVAFTLEESGEANLHSSPQWKTKPCQWAQVINVI